MRFLNAGAASVTLLLATAGLAHGWHLEGRVLCEGNGQPLAGVTIHVISTNGSQGFSGSATTDESGYYSIPLPDEPRCYRATVTLRPGESVVTPSSGEYSFCTTDTELEITRDWVIANPDCVEGPPEEEEGHCWLTGGGAKFSPITGTRVGDHGPHHNWGGNVYPGCSPTAGDGGQWNHVAHMARLHFQGRTIRVLRCGNVDGIPPGSTSPATPFNYIEFEGSGTLKGIRGNRVNYGTVYFFARCEDRNEPGSNGQRDGARKDRYFLHVYADQSNPMGSTLLLVDVDGVAATVDPVTITDGNMQIHISSCDSPPHLATFKRVAAPGRSPTEDQGLTDVSFSASPNPTRDRMFLRFELPREATVSLAAYDITGRKVGDLAGGVRAGGHHVLTWNLRDQVGHPLRGGVYFLLLSVDGRQFRRAVGVLP